MVGAVGAILGDAAQQFRFVRRRRLHRVESAGYPIRLATVHQALEQPESCLEVVVVNGARLFGAGEHGVEPGPALLDLARQYVCLDRTGVLAADRRDLGRSRIQGPLSDERDNGSQVRPCGVC